MGYSTALAAWKLLVAKGWLRRVYEDTGLIRCRLSLTCAGVGARGRPALPSATGMPRPSLLPSRQAMAREGKRTELGGVERGGDVPRLA